MVRSVLAVSAAAMVVLPAAAAPAIVRVEAAPGISVVLPPGWHLTREVISSCDEPRQVLAARARDGSLVLLLEDHTPSVRLPSRPAQFRVPRRMTSFEGCCDMPTGPGYDFVFRDRGRNFHAFVYPRGRGARPSVDLLSSLRVARI
ncbi:MAG: hypothetical protein WBB76_06195 [Gaiellaceae bacterium]